jgi:O-antigen/teichoic acid export membrane protein
MVSILQFAIAITMVFFPKELLAISGSQYSVDTLPFLILVVCNLCSGLTGLSKQVLLGFGKSGLVLYTNIIVLGVAVFLNSVLIPDYGLTGAAFSALLAIVLQGTIHICFQTRLAGKWLYKPYVVVNAAWMLIAVIVGIIIQSPLAAIPLLNRILIFLPGMTFYAIWAWLEWKRMHRSH